MVGIHGNRGIDAGSRRAGGIGLQGGGRRSEEEEEESEEEETDLDDFDDFPFDLQCRK